MGPGDLLSSDVRADIAAEAYAAWGDCGLVRKRSRTFKVGGFRGGVGFLLLLLCAWVWMLLGCFELKSLHHRGSGGAREPFRVSK